MPDSLPKPPIIGSVPPRVPPVLTNATKAPLKVQLPAHLKPSWPMFQPPRKVQILTPGELDRFKDLLVFARATVEGYFTGKHKSPYHGSSVEFADYKEYVPGDELKRVDWRVFGRTRRLFVRQYEEETDMVIYLLVDVSASMNYAGTGRQSKYLLAAKIAAALAYLMIHQGDKAALALFAETVNQFLAPGGTRRHLHSLVMELERVQPSATTGMAQALQECNPLFKKRGRIVILSDFLTDQPEFFEALGQFIYRKFEILLLHVVDPDELNLPSVNAARFEDMETRELVEVEPEEIRRAYRERVRQSIDDLARGANERQVSHALVSTENPYVDAIEAYLGFRGRNSLRVK